MGFLGSGGLRNAAQAFAQQGRMGDEYGVHASKDELVIHPKVWQQQGIPELLTAAFQAQGMNPEEYLVGSHKNKINPTTGAPEFFGDDGGINIDVADFAGGADYDASYDVGIEADYGVEIAAQIAQNQADVFAAEEARNAVPVGDPLAELVATREAEIAQESAAMRAKPLPGDFNANAPIFDPANIQLGDQSTAGQPTDIGNLLMDLPQAGGQSNTDAEAFLRAGTQLQGNPARPIDVADPNLLPPVDPLNDLQRAHNAAPRVMDSTVQRALDLYGPAKVFKFIQEKLFLDENSNPRGTTPAPGIYFNKDGRQISGWTSVDANGNPMFDGEPWEGSLGPGGPGGQGFDVPSQYSDPTPVPKTGNDIIEEIEEDIEERRQKRRVRSGIDSAYWTNYGQQRPEGSNLDSGELSFFETF